METRSRYSSAEWTTHVNVGGPGEEYRFPFVRSLHPTPSQFPGMEYRTSVGWFDTSYSRRSFHSIPFISKSGKFSLHTLSVWKAYPEQVIFSLISTVYARILKILRKRFNYRVHKRIMNCAFKLSSVYVILKNNKFIDRFLGMARKGTPMKLVENYVHHIVCGLDENKRFVYSQAYFQANWLKFQVFRPRDKSSEKVKIGTHLRNLGFSSVEQLDDNHILSTSFLKSCDLWKVEDIVSGAGAHYLDGSSESAFCLSETQEEFWNSEDGFTSEDEN